MLNFTKFVPCAIRELIAYDYFQLYKDYTNVSAEYWISAVKEKVDKEWIDIHPTTLTICGFLLRFDQTMDFTADLPTPKRFCATKPFSVHAMRLDLERVLFLMDGKHVISGYTYETFKMLFRETS